MRKRHSCQIFVLPFTVRLADGGSLVSVGRVEILYSGIWGAVCDNRWDLEDANIVCRQLGYPDAVSAPRDSQFGKGSVAVWISEVECTGNENSISQCSHSGWGEANCWHGDVASAICSQPGNYSVNLDSSVLERKAILSLTQINFRIHENLLACEDKQISFSVLSTRK